MGSLLLFTVNIELVESCIFFTNTALAWLSFLTNMLPFTLQYFNFFLCLLHGLPKKFLQVFIHVIFFRPWLQKLFKV